MKPAAAIIAKQRSEPHFKLATIAKEKLQNGTHLNYYLFATSSAT